MELRLKIFGLVFQRDRIHLPEKSSSRIFRRVQSLFRKKARAVNQVHGQVLRVCKLFEGEGSAVLYGTNVFRISGEHLLTFDQQILGKIGRKNVAMLRNLEIDQLRESSPDAIASELSTMARKKPELANLRSLALLAVDSRFPEEHGQDRGDMDGTYNGEPACILPHLSKLVVNGNNMTLTVQQSGRRNEVSLSPHHLMTCC